MKGLDRTMAQRGEGSYTCSLFCIFSSVWMHIFESIAAACTLSCARYHMARCSVLPVQHLNSVPDSASDSTCFEVR